MKSKSPVEIWGNQFKNWERAERCRWQMQRGERCRWQMQRGERGQRSKKIEEQRKPEDFFGHRNRMPYFLPQAERTESPVGHTTENRYA